MTASATATTICAGTSVTFTATPTNGGTTPTYQWTLNGVNIAGATSSTYTTTTLANGDLIRVVMTSNATCPSPASATSAAVTMTVNPVLVPAVSASATSTTICSGTSVTFTATPTNGGTTPTYQWTLNGVNIAGATSSTYTTTTLANGDQIRVVMTSNATCASPATATSTAITITVTGTVAPSVTASATASTICVGTSVTFTATPTNGGATPTYQWQLNGVNIAGATSSTYTTTTLANGDQIRVVMGSSLGCATPTSATSTAVTMTVSPSVTPSVTASATATTICAGDNVTFTATPTNGGATPTYQWTLNGVNIAGATSSTYSTAALANGDQIRVVMTSNATCASPASATSTAITMVVNICGSGCTWTGGGGTGDWTNPANWSCGHAPTCADDVTIPAGPTIMPNITAGTMSANNVTIMAGATSPALTISGGALNVCGNWNNTGAPGLFSHINGTVSFVGSATQTINGNNVFLHLTVNNGGNDVTLLGATGVRGLLNLQNGDLNSGGLLTIVSTGLQTGMVSNTGGVVTGDATVQRFLPMGINTGPWGYHLVSSAASSPSLTVSSAFADDYAMVANTAYNSSTNPAYVRPFPNVFIYNEPSAGVGAYTYYTYFEKGFKVPNASDPIENMRGYKLNTPNNVTLDVTGTLNNNLGTGFTVVNTAGTSGSGWNMAGNPYPAPIRWSDVLAASPGVADGVYMMKPTTQYGVQWTSYVAGTGVGVNGGSNDIAVMQGFFVSKPTMGTATLNFPNSARHTTWTNPTFFRAASTLDGLVKLRLVNGQSSDEIALGFHPEATEGFDDGFDALKAASNTGLIPTLYMKRGQSEYFSINTIPALTEEVVIPLGAVANQDGKLSFEVSEMSGFGGDRVLVYLLDKKLNKQQELGEGAYTFDMTAGYDEERFEIHLKREAAVLTKEGVLGVYPNPTGSAVTLTLNVDIQGEARIRVTDISGRELSATVVDKSGSRLEQQLDLGGLASGMYLIEVSVGGKTFIEKVVVE